MSVSEVTSDGLDELIDYKLLDYARGRINSLATVATLDEVRAKLSQVKGSMAALIIEERGEF